MSDPRQDAPSVARTGPCATERTGVLVMAHGTPGSPEEIPAFFTSIRRGRSPQPAELADLERRYNAIGGTSPLADRTAAQVSMLEGELEKQFPGRFVVAYGAKHAHPPIAEAVSMLVGSGVAQAVGIVLAPHYSSMSIGQYADQARSALANSGMPSLPLELVESWHLEPGLLSLLSDRVAEATASLPVATRRALVVIFTAHSLPARLVDEGDPYAVQVEQSARAVAEQAGVAHWQLAWQSAGKTGGEWLGPDVRDVITGLAGNGTTAVVVCPIGFVSDHLETLYDLDIDAAGVARRSGVAFARTRALDNDPRLGSVLAQVVAAAADRIGGSW